MASFGFLLSFLVILLCTVAAGIAAKRSVRRSSDFSNAGSSLSAGMVAGALVGGFVGGTSIVGTGELAFQYGLSSIWFTLGGGVAVMLLGLSANRFIRMRVETLPELIGQRYGERSKLGASLFLSLGMFIQVIAQLLAALPFVSVFWKGPVALIAFVPACLIFAYVLAGGFMGASLVGSLKTGMLILLLAGTGFWLSWQMGGETFIRWWEEGRFSLTVPEAGLGWAQGAAMIVGIFSTQAYLQPIFASRDARQARTGAMTAGLVIILIGLVSAWIGMYMRDAYPLLVPREAVPQFFLLHSPAWLAGAAYAIILLSVVMTGAALTLSIATILHRDVIASYWRRKRSDTQQLVLSRLLIIGVILSAYGCVCFDEEALILHWAFLAMTLRGVTVFLPVLFFLFRLSPVHKGWAAWATWGAPLLTLVWTWAFLPSTGIDPLYVSSLYSLIFLIAGRFCARKTAPSLRPSS